MFTYKKLIVTVVICTVMFLAVVFFLITKESGSYSITQQYAVPSTYTSAVPFGTNTMLFSNGRAFVVYNYATGTSRLVSPDNTTSDLLAIDSVSISPDKQYILFHVMEANPGGALYNLLQTAGRNTATDYWWIYNIAQQTFQPLPGRPILAKLEGDTVDTLASTAGSDETITSYSASDLHTTASYHILNVQNFYPTQNGFILQTTSNQVLFTVNGTDNKVLYTNATILGVAPNGQSAIGLEGQGPDRNLLELSLQKSSMTTIASSVVGQPLWTSSGDVLYGISDNTTTFYTYSLATHSQKQWDFSPTMTTNITPDALLGSGVAVVSGSSNSTYLIGAGLAAIKPIASTYLKTLTVDGNQVDTGYAANQEGFEVSLTSTNTSAVQAAVYQQLEQAGYNPQIVPISFVVD